MFCLVSGIFCDELASIKISLNFAICEDHFEWTMAFRPGLGEFVPSIIFICPCLLSIGGGVGAL